MSKDVKMKGGSDAQINWGVGWGGVVQDASNGIKIRGKKNLF